MLLIAIIIGFGLGVLTFRRKAVTEGNTTAGIEPSNKAVKAAVDGKPVHSYVVDDREGGK